VSRASRPRASSVSSAFSFLKEATEEAAEEEEEEEEEETRKKNEGKMPSARADKMSATRKGKMPSPRFATPATAARQRA
jgi:hypothetical protein